MCVWAGKFCRAAEEGWGGWRWEGNGGGFDQHIYIYIYIFIIILIAIKCRNNLDPQHLKDDRAYGDVCGKLDKYCCCCLC